MRALVLLGALLATARAFGVYCTDFTKRFTVYNDTGFYCSDYSLYDPQCANGVCEGTTVCELKESPCGTIVPHCRSKPVSIRASMHATDVATFFQSGRWSNLITGNGPVDYEDAFFWAFIMLLVAFPCMALLLCAQEHAGDTANGLQRSPLEPEYIDECHKHALQCPERCAEHRACAECNRER